MVGLDIKQNGWNMKTSRELQVRQSGLLEIVCVCNRRDCCFFYSTVADFSNHGNCILCTCVYIDYRNCCKNTDFWRSDIWMAIYGMYYAIHRWNSTVLYRYFGGVFCKSIYGIEKKTNFYLQRDKYSAIGFYI